MNPRMKSKAVRVPDALWEAAKAKADEYDVSLGEVIRKHLEDLVASTTWYVTKWDCVPPAWGAFFVVEEDVWSEDLSERHIRKWKPAPLERYTK